MSSHEIEVPYASATDAPAGTSPGRPADDPERRWPRSTSGGIGTGVHWRPGPASAWRFMTETASAPVEREP
jgi:hypothetical protein